MSELNGLNLFDLSAANRGDRELLSTKRHTTRRRVRHAWILGLAAALAACGGKHTDSYKQATTEQQACCENLDGQPRTQCMESIVTIDDPAASRDGDNQRTFRCVEDHFTCDPATGHATQESAQEQYDCIISLND